jgi:NitT/TauT family transport system permease protein
MASIGLLGFLSDFGIRLVMARVLHWQRNTTIQSGES